MNSIQLLHDFKNESVHYDEDIDTLFLKYKGPVKDDFDFIKINTILLQAFKMRLTQKFAVDARTVQLLNVRCKNSVAETLFPEMIKHLNGSTLYHTQLIDSANKMSTLSASNVKLKAGVIEKNICIEQFTDETAMREKLEMFEG